MLPPVGNWRSRSGSPRSTATKSAWCLGAKLGSRSPSSFTMRVSFHPEAVAESAAAHDWYRERSPRAAARFLAEIDRAIARILERPTCGAEHRSGTRRYPFRRFPFVLVYRVLRSEIQVLAIAHGKRRPGYWRHRA